ncbi:MAG: DUF2339 domain-containing protein, partial [Comamonadaceae bacterium]|nr:DUF2339 domain-containing protein [Comamonadaceae bacterium]
NTIVRVGLVILFVGLSFLARYAAQAGLLPVELRLSAIGAAGLALLAVGFRQRLARPGFGLSLQGAGVAVLYLTVFGAFRFYALVPPLAAFVLMVAVCAGGCALALLQNARALALLAFAGGFAVPLLLSSGGGSHVALFSYYMLLNLGIVFIASQRAWRALNLLGFVATFGVATLWGVLRYEPAHYATAQAFLLGFVAIYVAAAVLYARRSPTARGNAVDATLVFGTPLAGFGLQAGLVQPFVHGAAFSALGFGAVYLLLAAALARRTRADDQALGRWRLLVESFLALGVGFATLAVPLALDARWTSAVWALEGAAAFWVGARQARWMPRAFGLALQGVALLAWLDSLNLPPLSHWPLAHPGFLGALLLALAALACAWWARQPLAHSGSHWAQRWAELERQLAAPLFLYGFAAWCVAWALEMQRRLPAQVAGELARPVWAPATASLLTMLALLLSAGGALWLARRARWPVAAWPSMAALPLMLLTLLHQWDHGVWVLDGLGPLAWPLALALHGLYLHRNEHGPLAAGWPLAVRRWLAAQHPGTAWLLMLLLGDALWALVDRAQLWRTAWASVIGLVAATAVLAAITRWAGPAARAGVHATRATAGWPLRPHALGYLWTAALPLAVLVLAGALALAWTSPGHSAPLPYVPLLNPTDLAVALALGSVLLWRRAVLAAAHPPAGSAVLTRPAFWAGLGLLALVALSTVWLRVAHHFFDVAWTARALFASFVVQTGYSILWTLLALALMVGAHRRAQRPPWLAGAALLALVVAKLVLVDLANSGGAERIVAFIGVGVLMLVMGYIAPLPPKTGAPVRAATGETTP